MRGDGQLQRGNKTPMSFDRGTILANVVPIHPPQFATPRLFDVLDHLAHALDMRLDFDNVAGNFSIVGL